MWWNPALQVLVGGDGVGVGAGGVTGGEAFGAARRGLSGFLSERSFGAALTAG